MIENRWLVELFEKQLFGNTAKFDSGNWLKGIDNASSWAGYWDGPDHWLETHLYSGKQIREKILECVKRDRERHQKWLEMEANRED